MSAENLVRIENSTGSYAFVPCLGFASSGVVSLPGMTIDRVALAEPLPLPAGYQAVHRHMMRCGRPMAALCAMELRSPAQTSLEEFLAFNDGYLCQLDDWGLLADGESPLARTNVVPGASVPAAPALLAFAYTREADEHRPAFVLSGAAELPGTAPGDLDEKVASVLSQLQATAGALAITWDNSTSVHLYTRHPTAVAVLRDALGRLGIVPAHGITWHDAAPPVRELELELDLRWHAAQFSSDLRSQSADHRRTGERKR